MKAVKWLDKHFEEVILVVLLVAISIIILMQVIARNFFSSISWAEEVARFCWIWSVFLSLPYTIRYANMLRVNVVVDLLPEIVRKVMYLAVEVVVTVMMAVFAFYSIQVIQNYIKSAQTSPALQVPMWLIMLCTIVGFGLGTVRGIQSIIKMIMHFGEKSKTTIELTMEEAAEETSSAMAAEGGDKT